MMRAIRCVAAHQVDDVAFSPDGKTVVIGSSDFPGGGTLQLFDIDTGAVRWKYSHWTGSRFNEVTFSADGSLLLSEAKAKRRSSIRVMVTL